MYGSNRVGDVEIITDLVVKKDVWFEGYDEHLKRCWWPGFCGSCFTTKRYNLRVDMGEGEEGGFDIEP